MQKLTDLLRRLLAAGVIFIVLPVSACAQTNAQLASRAIALRAVSGGVQCSATAVGRHALLTASHCELPTGIFITPDYEQHKILEILRDEADHSIFLTDATFRDTADFAPELPTQGDDAFIFGNPGGRLNLLRRGYYAGTSEGVLLFDMNTFHGDSGAAIFNTRGQIVGVVSFLLFERGGANEPFWSLAASFPLAFTKEQLEKARNFDGK